jgi:hypothetical protein
MRLAYVLIFVWLIVLPGCSCFRPSTESVTVSASDSEAEIFADGQHIGTGAGTAHLKRNESHSFMAKMKDGRAGTAQVGRSMSTTATLDIIGGIFFLIPFVGLLAPGAWDLDATSIQIAIPMN